MTSEEILSVALSKGRLQDGTLELLGRAGLELDASEAGSRKLIFRDRSGCFQFFMLKPVDVPTYVEYGVADLGIAGWDVLLESEADVHQPLDLGIGRCVLAVAGPRSTVRKNYRELSAVRIATKYPRITTEHFTRQGVPVEIIYLSGSVELAPRLGLSERIVDLVASWTHPGRQRTGNHRTDLRCLGPPDRQPGQLPSETPGGEPSHPTAGRGRRPGLVRD